jgi:hypothetical protein
MYEQPYLQGLFDLDPDEETGGRESIPEERRLRLSDPVYETAVVLRDIFALMEWNGDRDQADAQRRSVVERSPTKLSMHYVNVATFIRLWDCPGIKMTYLSYLRDLRMPDPLSIFLIGAELDCPKTCAFALDPPRPSWDVGADHDHGTVDIFDLARWPDTAMDRLPAPYRHALLRIMEDYNPAGALSRGAMFKELLGPRRPPYGEDWSL